MFNISNKVWEYLPIPPLLPLPLLIFLVSTTNQMKKGYNYVFENPQDLLSLTIIAKF